MQAIKDFFSLILSKALSVKGLVVIITAIILFISAMIGMNPSIISSLPSMPSMPSIPGFPKMPDVVPDMKLPPFDPPKETTIVVPGPSMPTIVIPAPSNGPAVATTASPTIIESDAISKVYNQYGATMPIRNSVTVCSGYGCQTIQKFVWNARLYDAVKSFFNNVNNAEQERKAIALAIGFVETVVGPATGTTNDRPSIDMRGSGDPTQMDCVDEALNSTSYMILMHQAGLIKFHNLSAPNWKGGFMKWTHYAAVITDVATGVQWAVDSGVGKSGEIPLIIEYSKWYK
jgi:hypothetical protein